jgi:competence protein ComEA
MEADTPRLGVATATSPPAPAWQESTQWLNPPGDQPVSHPPGTPPAWPRSAQRASAALLLVAVGLLVWHACALQRWTTQPTILKPGISPLNLNRADRSQLLQLPGVGEGLAQRIEEYRREHGFRQLEDLRRVPGIGPTMLERLRPFVYVDGLYEEKKEPPALPPNAERKPKEAAPGKKVASLTGPIDVNRASVADLQRLPGIGPKMSQRIVEIRRQQPFRAVEDLRRVPGIGAKTLERLRPHVTVEGAIQGPARQD